MESYNNTLYMNPNIEYEKFTQEIYQELVNADVLKTTDVQHNVKLRGRSGQEHQIDVYWEYEIAGTKHKVAIECKNYNQAVPIGRVRDFFGALYDLVDVKGIMVTKVGYQKGAKEYSSYYGINLKELRFLSSHLVPISASPLFRTERLTSHLRDPSFILQSETPA